MACIYIVPGWECVGVGVYPDPFIHICEGKRIAWAIRWGCCINDCWGVAVVLHAVVAGRIVGEVAYVHAKLGSRW